MSYLSAETGLVLPFVKSKLDSVARKLFNLDEAVNEVAKQRSPLAKPGLPCRATTAETAAAAGKAQPNSGSVGAIHQGLNRGINKKIMDLWFFYPGPKTIY